MPFVTPRSTTSAGSGAGSGSGSSGRTTFRPPWVKGEDAATTKPATTPWAKKATANATKENGEKAPATAATTATTATTANSKAKAAPEKTTTTAVAKKSAEPAKKSAAEPVKKPATAAPATTTAAAKKNAEPITKKVTVPVKKAAAEPAKKAAPEPVKKAVPEPVKKAAASVVTKKLPAKKKEPTPPPESSSEEEESEEEEEESEEETESEEEETEEEETDDDEDEDEDDDDDDDDDDDTTMEAKVPEHVKKAAQLRPTQVNKRTEPQEIPAPPPLPSLVPKAPPPPPPPLAPGEKRVLSETQKKTLEKLKTRPRRRPDWSEMMKEVESGKKLRHVACNDRSQPILTCKSMTKVDDKFIYETEKDNSHNKLLKQIQGGVRLRPTQTNDRSKPILEGLRKFRRQKTIEEQLLKSQSKVNMLSEAPSSHALGPGANASALGAGSSRPSIVSAMSIDEESPDELDDIDKIRDDLQSTKQMLAMELRNREAQERENKKLLAKIRTLETELEREKSREKNLEYGSNVIVATMDPTPTSEQAYVNSLKREVEDARKVSKEVEQNYHDTSELLVDAKTEIEEQKRQIQLLERKLAAALQGGGSLDGSRRPSDVHFGRDSSPELDLELSESDPDEPEEKKTERRERRLGKEVKVLRSKLTKLKVKEEAAKKEKDALKQAMKKNHVILKEENKKFKKLEKEVQKMAASMKLDEDELDGEDKDDEEEAEAEEEEEEESEEESEESESEESGEESGSESEAEDSANSAKKGNLEPRVKKHESRFAAMKKCNVLLQANVDNLQDQISQVRSRATNLQDELDAVIADLGF
ncbi:DNA ligase 1 isoform X2 [Drosophila sulfurigaster albostrigata]|uniref:DNA ligase 1 isoform X2 n=1 Tax=Drosophila sulfurigaster albostrigata TaxID=89887 RepID=UPI002D21D052|nr:DNA ligase 1 isoform X2 [Drosophila sulfurigaster albostrigata]